MNHQIQKVKTETLYLDKKNPRLAEFGIKANTPDNEVFNILWENMALEEIVTSLASHGFFDTEPLIITEEEGKNIVIEGNRRLAAVMIVRNTSLVDNKLDQTLLERITQEKIESLDELPVIIVADRKEAWRFVGFKHINGPAKWNSFAKAQHIAQVHREALTVQTES